ncbi:MAG: hypothetical protein AB2L26_08385 [Ignavibacteria bacterium]
MPRQNFLKSAGASVFLSESSPKDKLLYFNEKELATQGIPYEIGGNTEKIFDADYFVTSPGISPNSEIIPESI